MTSYDFAISGQHYLFDVQSFAHTILALSLIHISEPTRPY